MLRETSKQAGCVCWMTPLSLCDQVESCWFAASPSPACESSVELIPAPAAWAGRAGHRLPPWICFFLKASCPSLQSKERDNLPHYLLPANNWELFLFPTHLQPGLPNTVWATAVTASSRITISIRLTSKVSILSAPFSALVFHLQCFAIIFATITFQHLLCQHRVSASAFNHQLFHHMAQEASAAQPSQHIRANKKHL